MSVQTTYTLADDTLQVEHETDDPEEAEAWSRAGFRVTAETRGVGR